MTTNITSKGQVTVPKTIRDHFGLTPGTAVEFKIAPDGNITLQKAGVPRPPSRFADMVGIAGPGMSTDEMMRMFRGDPEE